MGDKLLKSLSSWTPKRDSSSQRAKMAAVLPLLYQILVLLGLVHCEYARPPYISGYTCQCRIPGTQVLNSFRTAVPFWGQTTRNLTGLSPRTAVLKGLSKTRYFVCHFVHTLVSSLSRSTTRNGVRFSIPPSILGIRLGPCVPILALGKTCMYVQGGFRRRPI